MNSKIHTILPLCFALLSARADLRELPNFNLAPKLAPPIHSLTTVRDACANWWTLAPTEGSKRRLLVLPAQAPTLWIDPNIQGVETGKWQRVIADDDGFVWLMGERTLRFDPRKPELGATDGTWLKADHRLQWKEVARMPVSNHDLTAAVLNGKCYVAGGLTADFGFTARSHSFDELWELDPRQWVWRVAAKLYRDRIYCATAAFDGKVWVIGGDVIEPDGKRFAVSVVELIEPNSGKVSQGVASTIARPMPLALEANGRLYVMGNPRDQYDQPGKMESIGKGETSWRTEPTGPAGMGALSGASWREKLYVVVPSKGLAIFDAKSSHWELIVPPSIPRSCQMAAYRGEIWMLGGQDIADTTQALIFNPSARSFRKGPPLPRPNSWGAAATVNGTLMFTGGAALRSEIDPTYIYNDRTFILR